MNSYRSSPIRTRRTRAEVDRLKGDLYAILAELQPATVRQTFYAAVNRGIIAKTEAADKNVVGRLLVQMLRWRNAMPEGEQWEVERFEFFCYARRRLVELPVCRSRAGEGRCAFCDARLEIQWSEAA